MIGPSRRIDESSGRPNLLHESVARSAGRLSDSSVLAAAVLISALPYLFHLGFYSDDWAFVGAMSVAQDQSLPGLWDLQYGWYGLRSRPTQIVYQALLYWSFGRAPLGYHVVAIVMLAAMAVMLYCVLRELRLSRSIALAIAAVYAMLPNYSTNRFWFASAGYVLTILLYLVSLYADLRAISNRRRLIPWKIVSLSALLGSALGYEVVIPLLFFNVVLIWFHAHHAFGGMQERLGTRGSILFAGSNLLFLALVIAFKAPIAQGAQFPTLYHLAWIANGSVKINFGTYGIGLPYAAWLSVENIRWQDLFAALSVGIGLFAYAYRVTRTERDPLPSKRELVTIATSGLVIFVLGYAIFTITNRIAFTSSGNANRLNMAASLGVAMIFVAMLVALSRLGRRPNHRSVVFSFLFASLCLMGLVVNAALANYWSNAWSRQQAVIARVKRTLPPPAPHTTVLLHGICSYVGPGVVFETHWDVEGLLRILYRDRTLRGDVTNQQLTIARRGLVTRAYNERFYPYDDKLLLLHLRGNEVQALSNRRIARRYLSAHPTGASRCQAGVPGYGVTIFPMDHFRPPFFDTVIRWVT